MESRKVATSPRAGLSVGTRDHGQVDDAIRTLSPAPGDVAEPANLAAVSPRRATSPPPSSSPAAILAAHVADVIAACNPDLRR